MKPVSSLLLFAACVFLVPAPSAAQSSSSRNSSNLVSVDELAMPQEAARAFEKGTALLLKGDPQGSIPYFQTVINLAPGSYRPYHNLALAFYRLGKLDDAARNFQKSIDLSKAGFAPSLFALSMIFYRRADFSQAESLVQKGLLLAPYSALGKYCLGLVQFSLGQLNDAERAALDSLKLDATAGDAHLLLAHIHERFHNPSAVLVDVAAYLRIAPHGDLQSDALALQERAQRDLARLSASLN